MIAARVALLLALLPAAAGAGEKLRAIDGDTLALGRERIRVMGLDTPELPSHAACVREGRAGIAARDFVRQVLASAGKVELDRRGADKYRRTLARVMVDGRDLADIVIAEGHGRAYDGKGPRERWCRR